MPRRLEIDRFTEAVEIVRRRFPSLRLAVTYEHPHVHAAAELPAQPGLLFDVTIDLQNQDELHLGAGALWAEWFPCGEQEVFDGFIEAVLGLLSGDFRILEYRVGSTTTRAELQRPSDRGWQTLATYRKLCLLPWRRSTRVMQNRATA